MVNKSAALAAALGPAMVEFQCSTFNRISRNATDNECQSLCQAHCHPGEPLIHLRDCLLKMPAACEVQADITYLTLPFDACGSKKGIRLRYPSRPILSDTLMKEISSSYNNLVRVQTDAHFKIMTTGQAECEGGFALCNAIFGDNVSDTDSCEIARNPAGCVALNATRKTDNFISFDSVSNLLSGSRPFFAKERLDIQIRSAKDVFGSYSACPSFTFADDDILKSKSSVISRERFIVAGLLD